MGAANAPLSSCRFHLHGERVQPMLIYPDAQHELLLERWAERRGGGIEVRLGCQGPEYVGWSRHVLFSSSITNAVSSRVPWLFEQGQFILGSVWPFPWQGWFRLGVAFILR
jgi:hypothetical protein